MTKGAWVATDHRLPDDGRAPRRAVKAFLPYYSISASGRFSFRQE
jgi:hypothetical protein